MSISASCPDDLESFGPWAGPRCRGGFDFTLLFEETILSILLSSVFLFLSPSRIFALPTAPRKVKSNSLEWVKRITSACFIPFRTALVGLWAMNSSKSSRSTLTHTHTTIASSALTLVLSLLYAPLSNLHHRSSIHPSFLLSIYLALSIHFDAARARTIWMLPNAGSSAIPAVFTASLALRTVMMLLESIKKRSILLDEYSNVSEESVSGRYNLGVFYWLSSLFFAGYRKVLKHEDLYPLDNELRSELMAKKKSDAWEKVPDKRRPGALFSSWMGAFVGPLMMPVIPRIFQIGFNYAQPFLITCIDLPVTPQTQQFDNNDYGLIGAYILVCTGIAVRTCYSFSLEGWTLAWVLQLSLCLAPVSWPH